MSGLGLAALRAYVSTSLALGGSFVVYEVLERAGFLDRVRFVRGGVLMDLSEIPNLQLRRLSFDSA
eukprot:2722546-Amphidinium_carterae.1